MEESEDGKCIRFFQWVDDESRYSNESILARLIDSKTRRIRRETQDEELYTQEELDALPDLQPVKVKWFVPINGTCFRFPARVLPPFRMTCKDHFKADLEVHLAQRGIEESSELYGQIMKKYQADPVQFREDLNQKLTEHVANAGISRLGGEEIPVLREEVKKYKKQFQLLEGATSQIIESVRLKYMEDRRKFPKQPHGAIVYAEEET